MAKTKIINHRGEEVELDLNDGIVPPGYGVRVSTFLIDGVPQSSTHVTDAYGNPAGSRPGHVYIRNDDDAEAAARMAYDAGRRFAENAWRPKVTASVTASVADQMPDNDVERARENYKKRMSEAWRTTGGVGFGPGSFGA